MSILHLLKREHYHLGQQSLLHPAPAQEGRQELIKKTVEKCCLLSVVLDRPFDEAKALVEDPDRLI